MDNHSCIRSRTMLGAFALLNASALLFASGCSSSQTTTQSQTTTAPAAAHGWDIDHAAFKNMGYQWDWSGFPPMQPGASLVHATAYHDVVITQGSGATLSVLDTKTGKVRWSKQVDRPTTQFFEPVRFGETIYVASVTDFYEMNLKNGNTIDQDPLRTVVSTPPAIIDNVAIFGTTAGELFAFQMDQDFKLWSYQFDGPISIRPLELDDENIIAISDKGDIRIINVRSAKSSATMRIASGATTDLLADEFTVYVGSTDQSIYSFSIEDGHRFWRQRSSAPITVQPTIHDGILYATTDDTGLTAIDSQTGEILWNNENLGGWVVGLLGGNELIVWTGYELVSVDFDRGDVLARVPMNNVAGVRTDMFEDGNLYIIALDGRIAKFSPR